MQDKFINSYDIEDYEILADKGWYDVSKIYKTKPFLEYEIVLENGYTLVCADDHIVFGEKYNEVFVKDLNIGDSIITDEGPCKLITVRINGVFSNMYDITVDSEDHRYYTNGILSHNTTTATVMILHYILFNKEKTVALLANKKDTAIEILDRIQFAYQELPKWLQQGVIEWNKGSMKLENGCKVIASSSSASAIRGKACFAGESRICIEKDDKYYYTSINNVIDENEIWARENISKKYSNRGLFIIYETKNKITGKIYVGFHSLSQESDLLYEFVDSGSVFKDGYLGSGVIMKTALEKYGPHNMSQRILFVTQNQTEVESFGKNIINENFIKDDKNYNMVTGGDVSVMFGENARKTYTKKENTNENID